MRIEVEQKYPVSDLEGLRRQLSALGATFQDSELQVDSYFGHPCHDFARTDEALRLRQVGHYNCLTYKGPKLDATTKTRREIELALIAGDQAASDATDLLQALGFTRAAVVSKHRFHSTLEWRQWEIGIALDDIVELGTFLELEIIATPEKISAAREAIEALAERLHLQNPERRSYLELLLEHRARAKGEAS
jgi:adenylate cyclase, class 2